MGSVISTFCVVPSEIAIYWHSSWRSSDCCILCGQAKEETPLLVGLNKSLQVKRASVLVKHNQKKGKSNLGEFLPWKEPLQQIDWKPGARPIFKVPPVIPLKKLHFSNTLQCWRGFFPPYTVAPEGPSKSRIVNNENNMILNKRLCRESKVFSQIILLQTFISC